MKLPIAFTVVALLLVSGSLAGPISVKDNNIGDIVTVGVNLQADIKTDIDTTIVNVLAALLTQVGNVGVELPQQEGSSAAAAVPETAITMPKQDLMKTIHSLKSLAKLSGQSSEETEKIFNQHAKEFIERLLQKNWIGFRFGMGSVPENLSL